MSEKNENEEVKKEMPSRELSFKHKDLDYKIKFPNTGQLMQISVMKANLSVGAYDIIASSDSMGDMFSQFSMDTISHLSVLCPELLKNLNVKTYSALELIDMKELVQIYMKQIHPWMNSWYEILNDLGEKKEG